MFSGTDGRGGAKERFPPCGGRPWTWFWWDDPWRWPEEPGEMFCWCCDSSLLLLELGMFWFLWAGGLIAALVSYWEGRAPTAPGPAISEELGAFFRAKSWFWSFC